MRATSRWLVQRTRPSLVKRTRSRHRTGSAGAAQARPLRPGDAGPRNRTGTGPPAARSWPVPWLPAGRGDRRRHHVLDPEPGAGPAVVARGPPAVLEAVLGQGLLEVLPQEVPVQPGRDVVPGQHLVLVAVAVHVVVEDQARPLERLLPQTEVEVLGPLLEGPPGPPHLLHDRPHAPVAPADDALGRRGLGVVPAQREAPGAAAASCSSPTLRRSSSHRVLPEPLERGVGLGHEAPHRGRHRHVAVVAAADLDAGPARAAMPSTSSSVSVGRPMRK